MVTQSYYALTTWMEGLDSSLRCQHNKIRTCECRARGRRRNLTTVDSWGSPAHCLAQTANSMILQTGNVKIHQISLKKKILLCFIVSQLIFRFLIFLVKRRVAIKYSKNLNFRIWLTLLRWVSVHPFWLTFRDIFLQGVHEINGLVKVGLL